MLHGFEGKSNYWVLGAYALDAILKKFHEYVFLRAF